MGATTVGLLWDEPRRQASQLPFAARQSMTSNGGAGTGRREIGRTVNRGKIREAMASAVELPDGLEALRYVVQALLSSGLSVEHLLEDLGDVRDRVDDDHEERVLEVMDLLTGWCAPSSKLEP